MAGMIVLNDELFTAGASFDETICFDGCYEKIKVTPLKADGTTPWYEVIFQDGETRHIQQTEWGWKFMDQFPEPDDQPSEEAEADLLLAQEVGMAIEAHYHME